MSKLIKMTPEFIEELKGEFSKALETAKLSDGKFTFSKVLGKVDRKASLYFEELAYLKMQAIVKKCDKEIAWHGLAKRGDDPEKDEYIIYDILVYPQEVTSGTVNTDQEKYQMWLYGLDDDKFNNVRMQGHSHVNMAVNPSGVDNSLYERILEQLEGDMFYIFLIFNKKNEYHAKIYDMAKNILFETADVDIYTIDDGTGILGFLEEADKMVVEKKTVPAVPNPKQNKSAVSTSAKKDGGTQTKKKKKAATQANKNSLGCGYYDEYDDYYGYPGWGGYRY